MRLLTPAISLIFLVHMNNLIKCSILALSFIFREGNLTAHPYASFYNMIHQCCRWISKTVQFIFAFLSVNWEKWKGEKSKEMAQSNLDCCNVSTSVCFLMKKYFCWISLLEGICFPDMDMVQAVGLVLALAVISSYRPSMIKLVIRSRDVGICSFVDCNSYCLSGFFFLY